ncbi:MAG: hypothetical protein JW782_05505 [Candidatus Saganbacteria bacterium]|nr:hypothetical protein [Candidatus Saganbacteria bacterium]
MSKRFSIALIGLALALGMVSSAAAMVFSDGVTTINILPNSGCSTNMTDGSTNLQDVKGSPFGSPYTDGTTTIEVGLGYLTGSGEGVYVPPGVELVDTGRIRNTKIVRVGEDLKVTWGYDALGPTAVRVAISSAPGQQYDTTTFGVMSGVIPAGTTEETFVNAAHDGNNHYIRILPEPLVNPDMFNDENNSITVGKVEVNCPKGLYVFASLPFQEDNYSLKALIGDQLGDSAKYLWWNGEAYEGGTYSGGDWNADNIMRIGEGFLLMATADEKDVALTGRFGTIDPSAARQLLGKKYNLIGFPYPKVALLEDMGVIPEDSSKLLRWIVFVDATHKQYYDGGTYNGSTSSWTVAAGVVDINKLELAEPRYYQPQTGTIWTIAFP